MQFLDDFDLCHDATFEDTGQGSIHRRSIEALILCRKGSIPDVRSDRIEDLHRGHLLSIAHVFYRAMRCYCHRLWIDDKRLTTVRAVVLTLSTSRAVEVLPGIFNMKGKIRTTERRVFGTGFLSCHEGDI